MGPGHRELYKLIVTYKLRYIFNNVARTENKTIFVKNVISTNRGSGIEYRRSREIFLDWKFASTLEFEGLCKSIGKRSFGSRRGSARFYAKNENDAKTRTRIV